MHFIGITGGVGAGKSTVLHLLREICQEKCIIIEADRLAEELMSPGHECYEEVIALDWPESILMTNAPEEEERQENEAYQNIIDRPKMAKFMYADANLLQSVNDIVHPAVRKEVLARVEDEKKKGEIEYFFLEAALLLECGYKEVCDEIWYIYADESVRRERLRASRGYSDEKIDSIMKKQLKDAVFKEKCNELIDNSTSTEKTKEQLIHILANLQTH